jgi:hypothetical protein
MRGQSRLGGRLLMAGVLAMAVGCGGDDDDDTTTDDGGDAADDGGVDSNTTLDQLSEDDAQAFCDEVLGIFSADDFLVFGCTLTGILQEEQDPEQFNCETVTQDCIDAQEDVPEQEPVCTIDPTEVAVLPDCASDVTVGELQDCLEAFFSEFVDVLDSVTCDTGFDEVPPFPTELPEECAALEASCPELFGVPG